MDILGYKKISNEYLDNKKHECSHIEYKASEKQLDKILKTICAYGNNYYDNDYSFIYIGIEEENDDNKKSIPKVPIKGIEEACLETIKNTLLSLKPYIYPNVNYEIIVNEYHDKKYLLLIVERQYGGPFQVTEKAEKDKRISLKPGRYIRVESDTRLARVDEEYYLLRKFSLYHFTSNWNNEATLDDLEYDYMCEYLNLTSDRQITSKMNKKEISKILKLSSINEYSTNYVKNYAILMFSNHIENYIPYSYIEIISDVYGTKKKMEAKTFYGPIWKQYFNVLSYIENNFLRTITLREDNIAVNKRISNFPFKAIEELIANAIVHKNYEYHKNIQIYINEKEINIVNYNKPLPPISIKDLNERTIFHERDTINPEIRDMFKDLGIIESYGTGIGEAKKACIDNESPLIYYKVFDNDPDVTSVVIPANEEYLEIVGSATDKNSKVQENITKNRVVEKIKESDFSRNIKNNLEKIYFEFYDQSFGPKNIIDLLGCANNTATSYIEKLTKIEVISPIKGIGKSRYMFIR